jgi:hypothetical protein
MADWSARFRARVSADERAEEPVQDRLGFFKHLVFMGVLPSPFHMGKIQN